jgi:hypothetical protein
MMRSAILLIYVAEMGAGAQSREQPETQTSHGKADVKLGSLCNVRSAYFATAAAL